MWTEVYTIHDTMGAQKASRSARRPRTAAQEASNRVKRDWLFGKWTKANAAARPARSRAAGAESVVPSGYGRDNGAAQQSESYGTPPPYDNTAAVTEFEQCEFFNCKN